MLKRVIIMCLIVGLSLTAHAGNGDDDIGPFVEGDAFVTLDAPQRYSDEGKVELVEVFSYACIHCANFAPYMQELMESLPEDVAVHLVPASFSRDWEPFARAYYAAQKLGVAERTHMALFDAKFNENYALNSLNDLANFYARHGVDKEKFLAAANADDVTQTMQQDTKLAMRWGIDATPTIVVAGKYRSQNVKTYQELAQLARYLIDKEREQSAD